jgi:hypothetical protein
MRIVGEEVKLESAGACIEDLNFRRTAEIGPRGKKAGERTGLEFLEVEASGARAHG